MSFTTAIPGLPGGPLVTDYPIRVDPIPISPRQRSGIKAHLPRRSVQHGNGNPDSSAQGERNFLHSLVGSDTWISYHATADDKELWVLVPLDEVTWQAADGGGPGNMNGLSLEMVEDADLWASPDRRNRCIRTCADFMGRCAARLRIAQPERHWDFNWVECCDEPCDVQCGNRHHCPDKLMSTGLWASSYVPQWRAARADELKRMGGKPTYATPHPPKLLGGEPFAHTLNGAVWLPLHRRRWVALRTTARREYAETDAAEVGPPIKQGTTATFLYSVANDEGATWFVSKNGSRCLATDFVKGG